MGAHHQDDLLAELVHHRGRELTAYALMLCGNHAQAQDLVQEALIKVISRARSGTSMESVEAYVRRTIANTYIDGYRRRGVWGRIRHLAASPADSDGPADEVADRVDLAIALRQLSPRERAVVVLRFYQDLPISAIAVELGLNQGTVKRYLSNATGKLRGHLDSAAVAATATSTTTKNSAKGSGNEL